MVWWIVGSGSSPLYRKDWRLSAITCEGRNGISQAMLSEWSRAGRRLTSVVHARGWSSDRSLGLRLPFGEPAATSSSASPCGLEHKQPRSLNTPTTASPYNLTHLALLHSCNNNTPTSLHTTHPARCSETTTTTTPSHCEPARHSRYISSLRANTLQLPSRPYLPGRICTRSCEAGFSGRRHCQQNPRCARRDQGELAIIGAPELGHLY